MERSETCDILEAPADGANPITGQPLPEEGPYHHPRVLRALYSALLEMRRMDPATRDARARAVALGTTAPANAGKPWTLLEDSRLASAHDARATVADLAEEHRRTTGAIEARLVRLGKLAPLDANRDRPAIAMPSTTPRHRTGEGRRALPPP